MKNRLLAGLSIAALSTIGFATFTMTAPDYTNLPAKPSVMADELASAKTSIHAAISAAEKATEGRASSATRNADGTFSIDTYGGAGHMAVTITATGEVANKTMVPWLPGDEVTTEWTTTPSGLKYAEIKEGTGPMPAGSSASVTVHYSGWLVDGTKFDSSVDRGQPATFPLNGVIAGWTEGVGSMKVGGKRKLLIPFALAYGAAGRGPTIPPKATLIFDVELLK